MVPRRKNKTKRKILNLDLFFLSFFLFLSFSFFLVLQKKKSGIGPEIADAVRSVFEAAGVPVAWDEQHIGKTVDPRTNSMVTRENLDSVLKHGIGLKGPMATPIGKGHRSLNLTLRKEL